MRLVLGLLSVLGWFPPAVASIELADPTGCLDAERLHNEVASVLGPRLHALHLTVGVGARDRERIAHVDARHRHRSVWQRRFTASVDDCPVLAEAIALSLEAGLAALPGWELELPRARWIGSVLAELRPLERAVGLGAGLERLGAGGAGLRVGAELRSGLPLDVGTGAASLTELTVSVTPVVAAGRWWFTAGAAAGIGWASGTGFARNRVVRLPRLHGIAQVARSIRGPLLVAIGGRIPALRARFEGPGEARLEAAAQVHLSIGIRGSESD